MKPLLPRDRATAVPALVPRASPASLVARFGAWARESLVARGIALLLGLGVLAALGGSAFAGGGAAPTAPTSAPSASASTPLPAAGETSVADAGAVPTTRPELLPQAPPKASTATSAPATRATPDDPVDLNTARVEDLRRLPGVGAKRAEAILALRARLPGGRFRQIEDLLKVKGVGRAMLRRLHPLVRL